MTQPNLEHFYKVLYEIRVARVTAYEEYNRLDEAVRSLEAIEHMFKGHLVTLQNVRMS